MVCDARCGGCRITVMAEHSDLSSSATQSVTLWLGQLQAGDSDAAQQLWQRYVDRLIRLASRKLGDLPRRVADEEDVVISAFNDFLRGVEEGRFARLDDREDLWQVLVMLTERKAIGLRRKVQAEKRGAGQVRGNRRWRQMRSAPPRRGLDSWLAVNLRRNSPPRCKRSSVAFMGCSPMTHCGKSHAGSWRATRMRNSPRGST